MAKKISSSDLFEQEDLFKGVRDSATKTLAVFNELQAELKATAQGLKGELAANTQASTAQLKQFGAATEQANKLMKQSIEIEKLKAQADQQKIKAEQEIVKLQKMQAQELARVAKEQEKAAQLAEKEGSAYAKLSRELNEARKAYKDLAVTNKQNTTEGRDLLDTITKLDTQLKSVDATVGQHQRNVGNYEGATKSLKLELRELITELQSMDASDPRFEKLTQRAGELKDQISDTQQVVQATAGTALENFASATSKVGQIGIAAFTGIKASMRLLGIENEGILEGMAKLQALTALSDTLKTFGSIGDTLDEIGAGFTAAATKLGLLTTATEANTAANVAAEAVGDPAGAAEDLATTIASTAATEANTAATMAGTAAAEADQAVTATGIALAEQDLATTIAGTTATVTDTAATVSGTAATTADTAATTTDTTATAANTVATETNAMATAANTVATEANVAATEAHVVATEAEVAATVADTTATEANVIATEAQVVATTGATTASKLLSLAMKTIPIVAIIAGIAALIANWDKLTAALSSQTYAQKISNQVAKESVQSISGELSAADKLSKQLKDETLTRAEKTKRIKEFQAAYPNLLSNINLETMSIAQINDQLEKNITLLKLQAQAKAIQSIREEEYKKILDKQTNSIDDNLGMIDKIATGFMQGMNAAVSYSTTGLIDFGDDIKDLQSDISNHNKKAAIDESNTKIKALDAFDKSLQKQIAAEEKKGAYIGENTTKVKDYSKATNVHTKVVNDNSAALERQRKELERLNNIDKLRREALDAIQEAESEYQDSLLSEQQQEINAVRDKYYILIEEAKKYGQDTAILEEAQQAALTAIDAKYAKERVDIEKNRRENILNQEEEFDAQYQEAVNSDKQNEINAVRERYFTLIEMAKQRGYDTKVLEEKLQKELKAIDDKYAKEQIEKDKKKNEEMWQSTQDFAQQTTDFFKKQSEERIAQMDEEIAAAEKQADYYRELAANGNINAQQSLAEQERIIAESNRRKEREQKRQQRMELANTIYQTYAGHAAKDPETALMKTIKDASLLQAFISTLPMFYDGTEDTGRGGGLDGKGGFHAVLHPHERVIPKSLNDQIGNLTNEQLTRLAMEYNNGRLVGQDVAHSSLEFAVMVNELRELKEVIKHKPETNIQLGEITQSAMEIVQSTRKGNTTVYNRFKVRS